MNHPAPLPTHLSVDYYDLLPNITSKGKPLATIDNLMCILDRLSVTVRYNVISKDLEILIPGASYSLDNNTNACLAWLTSEATKFEYPTTRIEQYLIEIADKRQYNPVAQWIESRNWDGVDRISKLNESLDAHDPALSSMLLTRWLISAVHAAYSPNGIENSAVLVLQGDQYAGKTSWFWSLLPGMRHLGKEGASLNTHDKDSKLGVLKYWLVELGELDSTFRKSDIAALKAFISNSTDEIRRPFARDASKYPRRTVFAASVNPQYFLADETGNRRFWTIACGPKLNPHHGIDMQQVWAQAHVLWTHGNAYRLTRDDLSALNESNEDFRSVDPIEELILSTYPPEDTVRNNKMTATDVLLAIGYDRPSNAQAKACSAILSKHYGKYQRLASGRFFSLPMKKLPI